MSRLDLSGFAAALDRHGAALPRWPEDLQESARELLAQSAQARALLAAQQGLEDLLAAEPLPVPSVRLRAAILAAAPQPRRSLWAELMAALGGFRIVGPAFAAALMLGLSFGSSLSTPADDGADEEDLVALAYLSDDYLEY